MINILSTNCPCRDYIYVLTPSSVQERTQYMLEYHRNLKYLKIYCFEENVIRAEIKSEINGRVIELG